MYNLSRFWKKVNISRSGECWEWTAHKDQWGYGRMKFEGRSVKAHRLSYCIHAKVSLDAIKGQLVLHSCDNPKCVNPRHLRLGTNADNVKDMITRGRDNIRGRKRCPSKEDILRIRHLSDTCGFTYQRIADEFGMSAGQIGRIVRRKKEAHIT